MVFVCVQFITIGQAHDFERPSDIYRHLCGKVVGTCFDWFSIVVIFMSFWVMIAGAGAVFAEHYGLPRWVGGLAMALVVGGTALAGLRRLVDVIGTIGPLIVVVAIGLGVAAILRHPQGIDAGVTALPGLDVTQATSSWYLAAISYVDFCMLWLAAFLAALGPTTASRREAATGAAIGAGTFALACMIIALGLLSQIEAVAGTQIPMLVLARDISPLLASGISVIVLAGIFTTAVPLLWTVSSRVFPDGSGRFRIATGVLAIIGTAVGLLVPFDALVNTVYVLNGYVGGALLAIMIIRPIVLAILRRRGAGAAT